MVLTTPKVNLMSTELQRTEARQPLVPPPSSGRAQEFLPPVFPQRPELLTDAELSADAEASQTDCQAHCFSTLNHNLAYCYDSARAIKCVLKQAGRAFRGAAAVSMIEVANHQRP